MKLKTLKEMKNPISIINVRESIKFMQMPKRVRETQPHFVYIKDLKQEAIKRVKSCTRPVDFTRNDRCGEDSGRFPYNYCDICQREIWFNNLTGEDLK